jgi:hypothetical protein
MFVMAVVAFVQPLFETPALACIYYFWTGFILARVWFLKREAALDVHRIRVKPAVV